MKFIGDPGSCHLGSLEKAKELVKIGADCGLDAVKFQLLTQKEMTGGNIGMDWEWLPELIEDGKRLGVEVFASVFDKSGIEWMQRCLCRSIKFSHSQNSKRLFCAAFDDHYVSGDIMNPVPAPFIGLYCIPEYPVPYQIDFEGLFPMFNGFSSHCLGIEQDLRAIEFGAKIIEKHFQGDWHSPCPDGAFALKPHRLLELVRRGRPNAARPAPSKPHPVQGSKE